MHLLLSFYRKQCVQGAESGHADNCCLYATSASVALELMTYLCYILAYCYLLYMAVCIYIYISSCDKAFINSVCYKLYKYIYMYA